jgi:DNA-directed RNA polymerase subunit L
MLTVDPILGKIQKYFKDYGIKSSISEKKLDFEDDYLDANILETKKGIRNVGTLKLENSPIDYINIIKKQEYARCDFAVGGHVGMGVHKHSWWKLRFFLAFPDSIKIGPFDIGTITTIKKSLFHTKVENFMWNGYQKLTTLPPGLVRDNVVEPLNEDQRLQQLMHKCLLKERTITISRYSPSHASNTIETNSKIIITSKWKFQKELFVDHNTIEMYEKMAEIVKQTVNNLKYHLT